MSFLRRRTSSTTRAEPEAAAAGQALTAPLLAREASDDGGADGDDALTLVAPTSSPSFAALLWQALVASPVATALSLLAPLLPERWRPLRLSESAQRALDALREDAARPFDAASSDHEADLRALWDASFGGDAPPSAGGGPLSPPPYPPGGRSPLWREAGWQGDDPRTDLRGGGRGALTAALHMRRERPLLWARLRDKRRGGGGAGEEGAEGRGPWVAPEGLEYPFGAAGVNVAFMVSQVAGLHSHGAGPGAAAAAAPSASEASPAPSSSAGAAAAAAGSAAAGGGGRGPAPSEGPPRTAAARGFAALLLAASAPPPAEGGGGGRGGGRGPEPERRRRRRGGPARRRAAAEGLGRLRRRLLRRVRGPRRRVVPSQSQLPRLPGGDGRDEGEAGEGAGLPEGRRRGRGAAAGAQEATMKRERDSLFRG